MKPQQILDLEKELGIHINCLEYNAYTEDTLWKIDDISQGCIYVLDQFSENIIGLNLTDSSHYIRNTSILNNFKELQVLIINGIKAYSLDLENLSNLIRLEANNSEIEYISLKNLPKLNSLDLGNNRITIIPENFLDKFPNLEYLNLRGNPIQNIPKEIIEQENCLSALKDYFQSIENEQDRQEFNEAKLIFVGRGMVGKTELADALSEENYRFNPKRPMTEGIRIKTWQTTLEKEGTKKDFNLNIWDFAGQEINYGTHQFFLTKSSIYVLVWRWRVDDPANRFSLEYWLNIIKLLSDNSPVLVVQNWIDEDGVKDLPRYQWKELFPNIVGFYQTSCKSGEGIAELATEIHRQITKLPHTTEIWNKNRVAIRQYLEQSTENYISYADYVRLCEQHQIDKTSAKFLSEQLHKIGVILHFRNDIRFEDTVILKPEWATHAAYKLIDGKLNPKGKFRIGELKNYWKEEIYEGKHQYLLNLMLRFYLIFNISRTDEYIVPDLLPENPPENLPDFPTENRLIFEYHYHFMPKSLLTHFICLNASYIHGNCLWKNGVFLQQNGAKARIISSEFLNYIRIEVGGQHSDEFLTILRGFIQTVHKDILDEEPKFKEVIPCPCEKCENEEQYFDRYFFGFQVLKELKLEGETTVRCGRNVKAKFHIDKLLTGIEPLKTKDALILEKLERIEANTEQILQIFSQEFSQIKQNLSLQEEQRLQFLEQLIDKQKPQNLDSYQQKAQIEFPKFDLLQAESQNFLAMAFYFLEILPENGDFSPAALQFCRALELEMKKVLLDFKNLNLPISMNNSGLGQNQQAYDWFKKMMNGEEITLPQMKAIFEKMPNLQNTQLFLELNSFLIIKPLYINLSDFTLIQIEIKNKDYRNRSAHTHPLSKTEAKDCKGLVLRSLGLWI